MISLISTVYNCKDEIKESIDYFLLKENESLYDQLIICDGGSTDGTIELLKSYQTVSQKLKILEARGANISRGRNIAIRESGDGIIIAFDSGTTYTHEWLKKMADPISCGFFDVVEGNSVLTGTNRFQKVLCHIIDDDKSGPKQGASHRCIAYKKTVWEAVGGYPEDVPAGEDTWFNSMVRKNRFRIKYDETAICYWTVRKDLFSYLKMIYRNISGHIRLKENRGTNRLLLTAAINTLITAGIISSFFSVFIFIITIITASLYFGYRLLKPPRYKYFCRPENFLYGVFILFLTDLTITRAFVHKMLTKKNGKRE